MSCNKHPIIHYTSVFEKLRDAHLQMKYVSVKDCDPLQSAVSGIDFSDDALFKQMRILPPTFGSELRL